MTRRLVVMRHAKSDYPPGVGDHDRPLSARGVGDARASGAWIRAHLGVPDHVVVSSARRTRGTWTLAAAELGYLGAAGYEVESDGPLTIDPRLYDASARTLLGVVRELPPRVGTALILAHNPGCEDLVSILTRDAAPEAARAIAAKYPTSGIAVLEFDGEWPSLSERSARLTTFVAPRGELA
jgi:phosphohistidine phosphatase